MSYPPEKSELVEIEESPKYNYKRVNTCNDNQKVNKDKWKEQNIFGWEGAD